MTIDFTKKAPSALRCRVNYSADDDYASIRFETWPPPSTSTRVQVKSPSGHDLELYFDQRGHLYGMTSFNHAREVFPKEILELTPSPAEKKRRVSR